VQAAALPDTDVPLIEVRHVKRYFGSKDKPVRAVDDVSFAIRRGETLGLVGESVPARAPSPHCASAARMHRGPGALPAAKTSVRCRPSACATAQQAVQIIFQDPYASLNPKMRISAILGEALSTHGLAQGPGQSERRIAELLSTSSACRRTRAPFPARVFRRAAPAHRRQRAHWPSNREFIVADEPLSALDVSIQAQVINLLAESARAPVADHALHLARSRRGRVPVRSVSLCSISAG